MEPLLLDRQVTVEYPVAGQDATYGTPIITWIALATIWANVDDVPPSRAESVKLGLTVALNQVRVRYRFRQDITSAMRIVVGARVLTIIAGPAEFGDRKTYSEVVCQSISS
jgi:SPP1 family predicted phage head-tail adaptor